VKRCSNKGHLEAEQNDRKVKRFKIKQKWVKKERISTNVWKILEWPMLEKHKW